MLAFDGYITPIGAMSMLDLPKMEGQTYQFYNPKTPRPSTFLAGNMYFSNPLYTTQYIQHICYSGRRSSKQC